MHFTEVKLQRTVNWSDHVSNTHHRRKLKDITEAYLSFIEDNPKKRNAIRGAQWNDRSPTIFRWWRGATQQVISLHVVQGSSQEAQLREARKAEVGCGSEWTEGAGPWKLDAGSWCVRMCTYACAYVCTCCCTTPLTTKTARTFHHAWPSFFLQTPLSLISNSHLFSLITHIPLAALINTGQAYAGKAELSRATSVSYTAYQTTGCGWMSMTSRVRVCVCVWLLPSVHRYQTFARWRHRLLSFFHLMHSLCPMVSHFRAQSKHNSLGESSPFKESGRSRGEQREVPWKQNNNPEGGVGCIVRHLWDVRLGKSLWQSGGNLDSRASHVYPRRVGLFPDGCGGLTPFLCSTISFTLIACLAACWFGHVISIRIINLPAWLQNNDGSCFCELIIYHI